MNFLITIILFLKFKKQKLFFYFIYYFQIITLKVLLNALFRKNIFESYQKYLNISYSGGSSSIQKKNNIEELSKILKKKTERPISSQAGKKIETNQLFNDYFGKNK